MSKTLKTKVDGQCPKCLKDDLITHRDPKTYQPIKFECKKCGWTETATKKEVKINISKQGADTIAHRLASCKGGDVLDISTKDATLVFIIKKQ